MPLYCQYIVLSHKLTDVFDESYKNVRGRIVSLQSLKVAPAYDPYYVNTKVLIVIVYKLFGDNRSEVFVRTFDGT